MVLSSVEYIIGIIKVYSVERGSYWDEDPLEFDRVRILEIYILKTGPKQEITNLLTLTKEFGIYQSN